MRVLARMVCFRNSPAATCCLTAFFFFFPFVLLYAIARHPSFEPIPQSPSIRLFSLLLLSPTFRYHRNRFYPIFSFWGSLCFSFGFLCFVRSLILLGFYCVCLISCFFLYSSIILFPRASFSEYFLFPVCSPGGIWTSICCG